jgi:hypothetical protein
LAHDVDLEEFCGHRYLNSSIKTDIFFIIYF